MPEKASLFSEGTVDRIPYVRRLTRYLQKINHARYRWQRCHQRVEPEHGLGLRARNAGRPIRGPDARGLTHGTAPQAALG